MGVSFLMRYIPCWVFFRIHIYMVLRFINFFSVVYCISFVPGEGCWCCAIQYMRGNGLGVLLCRRLTSASCGS